MTPLRLLSLWRERWGKEFPDNRMRPYQKGGFGAWGDRVSDSIAGSIPILGLFSVMMFAILSYILLGVEFSLTNQYLLSVFLLAATLFVRLYQGMIPTLVLMGFAFVTASRYLYWRFDSTLDPAFQLDFFLALSVWCIELYGVCLFSVIVLNGLWPIRQMSQTLPEDTASWPKVAVFICAANRSEDDIFRSLSALRLTEWPPTKLSLTVVDIDERINLLHKLTAMNVSYLQAPIGADEGFTHRLNRAMTDADSELAVILSAGQMPAPDFLKESSGWFVSDSSLGLVATPSHFLLPEPDSQLLNQLACQPHPAEIMITRVSHFLKVGGIPLDAMSAQNHIAQKLHNFGFGHAYWLQEMDTAYRIHQPLAKKALGLRFLIARACDVMGVYQPVLRYTLLTVPLLYLLADLQPMHASPELWSAYAIPHLLQSYAIFSRTNPSFRWPVWLELREGLFATYVLILTFFTAVWTLIWTWKSPQAHAPSSYDHKSFRLSALDWLMIWLHGTAIATGLVSFLQAEREKFPTIIFYLAWSAIVLLLLVAKFAVFKEATEVAQQKLRMAVMSGMIRLPNNRTVTCRTRNFPEFQLELDLSTTPSVKVGQHIKLSIFHAMDEFVLDVTVINNGISSLMVEVDPAWQSHYKRFSQAVFARGPNWPDWLPSQHVDKIIPQWFIQACVWLLNLLISWSHRFSRKSSTQAVNSNLMK